MSGSLRLMAGRWALAACVLSSSVQADLCPVTLLAEIPLDGGGMICLYDGIMCPNGAGGSVYSDCGPQAICDGAECSASVPTGTGVPVPEAEVVMEEDGPAAAPADTTVQAPADEPAPAADLTAAAAGSRKLFSNRGNLPVKKMANNVAIPADASQPLPFGKNGYEVRYVGAVNIAHPDPAVGREHYALYTVTRPGAMPPERPRYIAFRLAESVAGSVAVPRVRRLEPQAASGAVRELAIPFRVGTAERWFHAFGTEDRF